MIFIMANIVNGKEIAEAVLAELREEVIRLKANGVIPTLAVFLVGENPASLSYIKVKTRKAEEVGIKVIVNRLPESGDGGELEGRVRAAAENAGIHAILVQLPLPRGFDQGKVLNLIPPAKDVDSLSLPSRTSVIKGEQSSFFPPAAVAVVKILEHYQVKLKGKNIVIVGTGELVGRPLAAILLAKGVDFELANQYTENLHELLSRADVVVSAAGKAGLINGAMIKKGAVVIDAGSTGSLSGAISGDVEKKSVMAKASLLAPVPGGVGPVTVALLLKNVVAAAAMEA